MKFSLLVVFVFLIGCASNSSKSTSESSEKMVKKEAKKAKTAMKKKVTTAKKEAVASAGAKVCSIAGDQRTIEVKKLESGCEVLYTKFGETKSMATAQNDMNYCDEVVDKIATNLGNAGFNCK